MRVVVALGGNALLRRGEPLTAAAQHTNVRIAALALADLARDHQIIIAHGNGPQVGLMALQAAAFAPQSPWPLDVLGAETEGMIGYLIEQEVMNALPNGRTCATLLTRVEVDSADPAFAAPSKPIGPVYTATEAAEIMTRHDWPMIDEAGGRRRVVPSPLPRAILGLPAIRLLVDAGICVICAGGGGIPVMRRPDGGMEGVEAVIDKDRTAALLATELKADALLMLTDVAAIFQNWGTDQQSEIRTITPAALSLLQLDAGSMGPKAQSACAFVQGGGGLGGGGLGGGSLRGGAVAGIGRLEDARAILEGRAGTQVTLSGAAFSKQLPAQLPA